MNTPLEEIRRMYEPPVIEALDPPKSHTHSKRVSLPFWKWRLSYDPEYREFGIIRYKRVDVPCEGELVMRSPVKVEMERTDLALKFIASRKVECKAPSVPDAPPVFLMYAACMVSNLEADSRIA